MARRITGRTRPPSRPRLRWIRRVSEPAGCQRRKVFDEETPSESPGRQVLPNGFALVYRYLPVFASARADDSKPSFRGMVRCIWEGAANGCDVGALGGAGVSPEGNAAEPNLAQCARRRRGVLDAAIDGCLASQVAHLDPNGGMDALPRDRRCAASLAGIGGEEGDGGA